MTDKLPIVLTQLVRHAIACWGRAIREEGGEELFQQVESLRRRLKSMREASPAKILEDLHLSHRELESLSAADRLAVAHSFAVMLELINACENAYRTFRLRQSREKPGECGAQSILYVLTAHPTEARAPECVELFRRIQDRLLDALEHGYGRIEWDLLPLLKLAWKIPMAKQTQPTVRDEANHVYLNVLEPERLRALLQAHLDGTPLFLRSWVGGDKDGHPGVDENTMVESLELSRVHILGALRSRLDAMEQNLELLLASPAAKTAATGLRQKLTTLRASLAGLESIHPGDGGSVAEMRELLDAFRGAYDNLIGSPTRNSAEIRVLLHVFPGLVVPLELREGADLVRESDAGQEGAIVGMLRRLKEISHGGHPKWYVRGFVVSMVAEAADLIAAANLVIKCFGELSLPIVPLLEQESALRDATKILDECLATPQFSPAVRELWKGNVEVMLGYSDSAKEIGALPSRVLISEAMTEIDRFLAAKELTPIFFHGAGGSVARGGGSIYEQIVWWPASSLRHYKVTVQGEMVQRGFASPEILSSQLRKIGTISAALLDGKVVANRQRPAVEAFADEVRNRYKQQFASPEFLEVIQKATPYAYLSELKLGSRPSKRKGAFSLDTIRAIPWVLCWTQTRVLFPSWWGVGSAWEGSDAEAKAALRRSYAEDELFRSFVKLLGFTLAKVELPIWDFLLERSTLSPSIQQETSRSFRDEYARAGRFLQEVSGENDLLWFRPWLGESIRLRSSMIHVLNLTQQLAVEAEDQALLRESVTGIACGMLTTG